MNRYTPTILVMCKRQMRAQHSSEPLEEWQAKTTHTVTVERGLGRAVRLGCCTKPSLFTPKNKNETAPEWICSRILTSISHN